MSYDFTGKMIEKFDIQQITDTFKKREFVVQSESETNGMVFTEDIKFQLTQDRCGIIETFNVGEEIKVSFNLRGRRWEKEGKISYFTNLEAWRVERIGDSQQPLKNEPNVEELPPEAEENDDLPF